MTVLKGSDDQMVPDSSIITRNQTSGCTLTDQEKNAGNSVDGSLLSVFTATGIPDFDKLLAGLTSPTLIPTTSTTASFVLPTPAGVSSDAPTEDEASRSGTESDYILPPSPTVLPSIHDYLEDMETMYTEPRSFYDDYGIKKEPIDFVHDPVAQTELTPLKPAVGLAAVGFTSQGFTAPSQYTNPYLPPADDMAYSYNYYNNSTVSHNMASVSSAMPSGDNCSYGDCLPLSSGAVPAPYMDVEGVACENDLEKIQEKVDYASVTLGIPKDPRQWTAEQSHRWAEWTLSQYNLPSSNVTDFYVAGSLMNSLSQTDFQNKCPYYGEFLYAELDLWKNSFLVGTATSSGSSSNISSSEDEDSCRDLEQLNPTQAYPQSSQQDPSRMYPTSLAGIPTPVITPVNPAMTSSTSSVLPMTHSSWSDPMLIQTPISYTRHMSNGCSNMARMMSPSSISPVPSSSSSSAHLTWRDESHDEMNGLIGSSSEPPVGRGKHAIHLWQFLKELLLQPHQYHNCIRWLDRNKGIFKIEDSSRVALLWGRRKNRPAMNYDKLSRSIRQYYKKGIIKKTEHSKRLVYQFQPQYR